MSLKGIIWELMPYGVYNALMKRRHPKVFSYYYPQYIDKINKRNDFSLSPSNKSYSTIVSVEGLGYSGSGAVVDLLTEVDSCFTLRNASKKELINKNINYELDFLRLAGGLFEVENYLSSNNIYHNDALLNRLVKYLDSFRLFKEDEYFRNLCYDFFYRITEFAIVDSNGAAFNYHLSNNDNCSSIFFLRKMDIKEYRTICKNFLGYFFNYINDERKEIIVTDQLLSDQDFNVIKYREYIPESKSIIVYRDPRDVYTFAVENNISWIAHSDVEHFVKWFEIMVRNFNLNSSDYLVVQFEKLVMSYDDEITRIFDYLNIDQVYHGKEKKKAFFDPAISIKNIGIWKNSQLPKSDYELIMNHFGPYCFEN